MTNDELKEILHADHLSRTDKVLVALHATEPCSVKEITKTLVDAGVQKVKLWNISAMLSRTQGKAVKTKAGWELRRAGKDYLDTLGVSQINMLVNPSPDIFKIPKGKIQENLVSVMMPFTEELNEVYATLAVACNEIGAECLRADEAWEKSMIIDDIFALIYRSKVVISDFTGRNPNVFYETGIAHTMGRDVIPIVQSETDIAFDLRHHRHIIYDLTPEGLEYLSKEAKNRISNLLNVDAG